ncbi:hypothetical protein L2E82_46577 [Cichorium intybus]|uniref:Uncharacterized protein n=1 Tax=Cichorium intybus TaxID=13427 RepID=A0ACB8YUY0_CICIN|nr:hypothetical protein L1887_26289 [Cichorium endivia]KAI3688764.1 hypothetical protein L2E82_46577 [Cichorium intybus]
MIEPLPLVSSLSPSVLSFLDTQLHTADDLLEASRLVSELQNDCHLLDHSLKDLNQNLGTYLLAYSTHSDQVGLLFRDINTKLTSFQSSISDGDGKEKREKSETFLGKELPALAREVARVEAVRVYAETALKLDTLVGDIEDAVSSSVTKNLRKQTSSQNSEEARFIAINALKLAEEVLAKVSKTRPQWSRLVSAVDHRVDRALAILRPQAIADYRSLLTSLHWPPSLSTLNPSNLEPKKSTNPLFTMQGHLKQQYCDSFLALCKLQELQTQRKIRQLQGHNSNLDVIHQPLWAIEELVNPISIASQRHFSKWGDKPELIFALVYKITRDYVDSMDELLQPLVDKANLSGYSCREEWISAMVTSLSTYMAKEIFPIYIENITENRITWLHFIDLMISFDKKIKTLVAQSGIMLEEDVNMEKVSCLSVFIDRPDWLDLWGEIELSDAIEKLTPVLEDEKKWSTEVQESVNILGSEEFKSPAISSAFLRRVSSIIERCRSLPGVEIRTRFIRSTGAPIIHRFLEFLLLKCQEAEGLTALTDDDALIKVTKCINGCRYFESVLKEWCEEVFFLEMGSDGGIFDEEIRKLEEFRIEWVEKLSKVVFRGFDACCREYIKNKKQWMEKTEEGWGVSRSFILGLDYLQAKMSILEMNLNKMDFVGVWRQLASAIDLFVFNGVFMNYVKFSEGGVERLANDLTVLFGVFKGWCLRPEGFFGKLSEGLKLLKMEDRLVRGSVEGGERWLKQNGIRHLSVSEVERVVKSRVYGN